MNIPDNPRIETERLILRRPEAGDFDAYAAFMADEKSAEFLGGAQSRSEAWRSFAALVGSWTLQEFSLFTVLDKDSGRWLGRVGPWVPEGWPGTEVGWGIVRDAAGRGYATEAAIATIDWAFQTLGWREVIHTIQPGNAPSKAVARKLGSAFLREGRLPAPLDHLPMEIWGQSRAQWQNRNR